MEDYIKQLAKVILGEVKGMKDQTCKEFGGEIQKSKTLSIIDENKILFKEWQATNREDLDRCKLAKKATTKAPSKAKYKKRTIYQIQTKDGERSIYKLAKIRQRKTKNLDHKRYIKDENWRDSVYTEMPLWEISLTLYERQGWGASHLSCWHWIRMCGPPTLSLI